MLPITLCYTHVLLLFSNWTLVCPVPVLDKYNGVISSSYKRNGFSYSFIDSKDPVKLSNDIQEQLKKYACIYSNKDIVNKESDLSNANNEYVNAKHADNWKKIKSKKMKENLITNYCCIFI